MGEKGTSVSRVFSLHSDVRHDFAEAISYYAGVEPGLPQRFTDELVTAFEFIETNPTVGRMVHSRFRRVFLKHFPYMVYYRVTDTNVFVSLLVHTRRNPVWVQDQLTGRS